MSQYKLFLDDVRQPSDVKWVDIGPGPWVIVRNYEQFVAHVERHGIPEFVSFDHDLAEEHYPDHSYRDDAPIRYVTFKEKTGYSCAVWLANECLRTDRPIPLYQVHSLNPVGAENIRSVMEAALLEQTRREFQ